MKTKNAIKEMQQYSNIAWWKSKGNYEIGTGRSIRSIIVGDDTGYQKAMNVAMAPAGNADDITWAHMWKAVKIEVRANNKGLKGDA